MCPGLSTQLSTHSWGGGGGCSYNHPGTNKHTVPFKCPFKTRP